MGMAKGVVELPGLSIEERQYISEEVWMDSMGGEEQGFNDDNALEDKPKKRCRSCKRKRSAALKHTMK